jgi:hypothetical protein
VKSGTSHALLLSCMDLRLMDDIGRYMSSRGYRDCCNHITLLGTEHASDAIAERDAHAMQLRKLKGMINDRHSGLHVEMLLMALDGKVESIS